MIFHVRQIPSCPGYFVSDTGRVWGRRKELAPYLSRLGGYPRIDIPVNGRCQHVKVHHAVAEAFLGPKPPGAFVCHRNDIPTDNRPANLYYGDASTNMLDAYRNGKHSRRGNRGEKGSAAKLTWKQVRDIRRQHANGGVSHRRLARDYGVVHATIWAILHNVTWQPQRSSATSETASERSR